MSDKTSLLLSLRPLVPTEAATGNAESFQNETLRPILKLQNGLLIRMFKQYIEQRKRAFYKLNETDQRLYITQSLKQDQKFHQLLRGIVIGHFTDHEFDQFLSDEREINRRISNLLEQRLLSNIPAFKQNN